MPKTALKEHRRDASTPLSQNEHLLRWVGKMAELTRPEAIHWVDGSQGEYDRLCAEMCATGTLLKLNQDLWPAATMPGPTRTTLRASKIGLLSARFQETPPD